MILQEKGCQFCTVVSISRSVTTQSRSEEYSLVPVVLVIHQARRTGLAVWYNVCGNEIKEVSRYGIFKHHP